MIERFTDGPRRLLGFSPIHLTEGAEASLVLWARGRRPVEPHTFASKAKYSPWAGWVLRGWPSVTLVEGRIVYQQQKNG